MWCRPRCITLCMFCNRRGCRRPVLLPCLCLAFGEGTSATTISHSQLAFRVGVPGPPRPLVQISCSRRLLVLPLPCFRISRLACAGAVTTSSLHLTLGVGV